MMMKLASFSVALLLAVVGTYGDKTNQNCDCLVSLVNDDGSSGGLITNAARPVKSFIHCDKNGLNHCARVCDSHVGLMTRGGDLNHVPDMYGDKKSIGQKWCEEYGKDVERRTVGVFATVSTCGTEEVPRRTDIVSTDRLCCSQGKHTKC